MKFVDDDDDDDVGDDDNVFCKRCLFSKFIHQLISFIRTYGIGLPTVIIFSFVLIIIVVVVVAVI